jgi:hypothetical protein
MKKIINWLLTTKVSLLGVVMILAALVGAGLYANYELARHSPVAPVCPPVVTPAPEPQPLPPVTPVVVEKPAVAKPIIYLSKSGIISFNSVAKELIATTHVLHIQYGNGYNVIDLRHKVNPTIQSGDWPPTWKTMTVGLYNPNTGQYAVSVRVGE